ncbi:hypothetical protein K493DRAFT_320740 [Basidiobolus meristosporus CBS 931.73]|uniref:Zinc finger HIT domain-containing protein 3 n=1 Tax=Basidiobolus meristosporus CBS 931.73 TaxID=1314790 RepID=A0A1Y1X651_9FUNG|nr:hypothetical protein K493DRAFT_320740 [Basidiobolus meristosporus CBS 931.73]|eukprot:ORX81148.1 hypothetical protein K493DRAFT_320740 [Basidiobolus meristosporus CBS 931.73]
MNTPNKPLCKVCNTEPFKYKCSVCLLPYCSVTCYKKHKEVPCQKPAPKVEEPPVVEEEETENEENKLSDEQLQMLASSDKVREMLKTTYLKELIKQIDSSDKPEKILEQTRQKEPLFDEFANTLIDVLVKKKEDD